MPLNQDKDIDARSAIGSRGVRRLLRPAYARIITDPANYDGFATIRVGDAATKRSVREVQTTAFREAAAVPA